MSEFGKTDALQGLFPFDLSQLDSLGELGDFESLLKDLPQPSLPNISDDPLNFQDDNADVAKFLAAYESPSTPFSELDDPTLIQQTFSPFIDVPPSSTSNRSDSETGSSSGFNSNGESRDRDDESPRKLHFTEPYEFGKFTNGSYSTISEGTRCVLISDHSATPSNNIGTIPINGSFRSKILYVPSAPPTPARSLNSLESKKFGLDAIQRSIHDLKPNGLFSYGKPSKLLRHSSQNSDGIDSVSEHSSFLSDPDSSQNLSSKPLQLSPISPLFNHNLISTNAHGTILKAKRSSPAPSKSGSTVTPRKVGQRMPLLQPKPVQLPITLSLAVAPASPTATRVPAVQTSQMICPASQSAPVITLQLPVSLCASQDLNAGAAGVGVGNCSANASPALQLPPLDDAFEDDASRNQKRYQRMLRNRESASMSRQRRKLYLEDLEEQLRVYLVENSRLRDENEALRLHVAQLENQSIPSPTARTVSYLYRVQTFSLYFFSYNYEKGSLISSLDSRVLDSPIHSVARCTRGFLNNAYYCLDIYQIYSHRSSLVQLKIYCDCYLKKYHTGKFLPIDSQVGKIETSGNKMYHNGMQVLRAIALK